MQRVCPPPCTHPSEPGPSFKLWQRCFPACVSVDLNVGMTVDVYHPASLPPLLFLQVEGNPFLEVQGAARSLAGILAHLGGLKDLDGPVSVERKRRAREVGGV